MTYIFKRLILGNAMITPFLADAALTVLRVFAGLAMALAHGWNKFPPGEGLVQRTEDMGFPAPTLFAWLAGICEFIGGLMMAAGFVTRVAAFMVAAVMTVAVVIAHAGDDFRDRELALLFLAISVAFLFVGGGRYSVDRFLRT